LTACLAPDPRPAESPLIPNQVPVLLENQWRLTEIIHNGARRNFDNIKPVLVTFQPGILAFQACNSTAVYMDTTGVEDPNEYRFSGGVGTARQCINGGTEQEGDFTSALYDTSHYVIEADTLILFGDHARLTFVIDNEAEKPADWM
jgi:heat shock protein HslJ